MRTLLSILALGLVLLLSGPLSAETFKAVIVPNSLANVEGNQENRVPFTITAGESGH